jgi:hypothetical protein
MKKISQVRNIHPPQETVTSLCPSHLLWVVSKYPCYNCAPPPSPKKENLELFTKAKGEKELLKSISSIKC